MRSLSKVSSSRAVLNEEAPTLNGGRIGRTCLPVALGWTVWRCVDVLVADECVKYAKHAWSKENREECKH
jgi:hypothetical protein